ncbi:MAG: type II toxin-antitoxin system HicA family toxin [Phycisphaerae bacterium]|nr:type II toxin-antitoxin system HicA family toxin [Phycisphaerae bacterium]
MRLPRDISAADLIHALARLGYHVERQSGSHVRLGTTTPTEHHITVPAHDPIKIGTLAAILRDVGAHARLDRDALLDRLFG